MTRTQSSLLLAAAIGIAAGAAFAAEPDRRGSAAPKRHDADSAARASAPSRATGGAFAPNARLAALIDQGGGVVRSKGVSSVSRPGTGRYCIRPRGDAEIDVDDIVPVVSVDFSNSSFNESTVQYRSSGDGCPSNSIAVMTFADTNLDGIYGRSNSVAFTIIVP